MKKEELAQLHQGLSERSFLGEQDSNLLHSYFHLTEHSPLLGQDLATLESAQPSEELLGFMLSDLLINGEESESHGKLMEFYGNLYAEGNERAVDTLYSWGQSKVSGYHLINPHALSWISLCGDYPSPEDVAATIHGVLSRNGSLSYLGNAIKGVSDIAEICSNQPTYPALCATGMFFDEDKYNATPETARSSATWQLISHQDAVDEFSLLELYAMAQDYNWEWALAAFDWSPGVPWRNSYQGQLQTIVDASPW